jgi:predicted enzyme related to lactoylglutathione lyase
MPSTIVHFEIPAKDVEKLKGFYAECLGWKFEKADMPGMPYWMIRTGEEGKSVGGGMFKKEDPGMVPVNYFGVDSADSAAQKIKKAGGQIFGEKREVPGMGWFYMAADPEGNPFAVWQPAEQMQRRMEAAAATH